MNCPNCNYPLDAETVCPGCGETITQSYREFLESKIVLSDRQGFDVEITNPALLPHAQVVARWALNRGRALIAASFGMTKTRIQCEIMSQIYQKTGQRVLVVCPLGVRHQFVEEDGPAMGQRWEYVRTDGEIELATSPFLITNYERPRDGSIIPAKHNLAAVSLDEGAILQGLGTKTYSTFREIFKPVPFRRYDWQRAGRSAKELSGVCVHAAATESHRGVKCHSDGCRRCGQRGSGCNYSGCDSNATTHSVCRRGAYSSVKSTAALQ